MDFTIKKEALLGAIDKCQLATDKSHVTESFRLMTVNASKNKSVSFSAVGEFCSVDTVADAEVKTKGAFNVMPGRLRDIAMSMPAGAIQFSLKGTRVTVKSLVSSRKATFESHSTDPFRVSDPGKEAAWIDINAGVLLRAVKVVKAASIFEDGSPIESLLLPTERGLDVYGCNGYLIAVCETPIRIEGRTKPIQLPAKASDVLALMPPNEDGNVRLYTDDVRIYLESDDTLVSAVLWAQNPGVAAHPHMLKLLKDPDNIKGPVLDLEHLAQGVKSVLALTGFAGDKEKGSRGYQLHATIGADTCVVELGLSEADARDEFDVAASGAELEFLLSSALFEKMLSSLAGYHQVQAYRCSNLLLLRSQGVLYGIMEEVKK